MSLSFQELVLSLQAFWSNQGCLVVQPYDTEKGAGTLSPHTFLRALGPEPWNVAYVEPCRRPTDGRYGENPNRLQHYFQFQVLMKPSPADIQDRYLQSLAAIGIDADAGRAEAGRAEAGRCIERWREEKLALPATVGAGAYARPPPAAAPPRSCVRPSRPAALALAGRAALALAGRRTSRTWTSA